MKAEHRKELQTNALADRMGRLIQRMKVRPRKNTVLTWFLVAILVLAVVFFFVTRRGRTANEARLWAELQGVPPDDFKARSLIANLKDLESNYGHTNQGKAARFELAYYQLWEVGIKFIPNHHAALDNVKKAKEAYQLLAEECKDDPVLGPEALYNIAVAEETFAIRDPEKQLKEALKAYQAVVNQYPKSAHAKTAKERVEELENPEHWRRINAFYSALRIESMVRQGFNAKEQD